MPALSSAKSKAVSSSFFPLFLTTCTGFARLDPKMFGHPNNRLRTWRICYHRQHRKWSCQWSLDELASMILCPKTFAPELNYSIYLRPMPPMECIREKGFDRVPGLELQWGNNLWIDAIFWFGPISFFFQLYSQWEIEVPAATLAEVPGHGSQQEGVRFVSQCWQTQADRSPAFCFALLDNIFPAVVSCLVGHGKS